MIIEENRSSSVYNCTGAYLTFSIILRYFVKCDIMQAVVAVVWNCLQVEVWPSIIKKASKVMDSFTIMKRVKNQITEIDCYQDCMVAVHTLLSEMALISGISWQFVLGSFPTCLRVFWGVSSNLWLFSFNFPKVSNIWIYISYPPILIYSGILFIWIVFWTLLTVCILPIWGITLLCDCLLHRLQDRDLHTAWVLENTSGQTHNTWIYCGSSVV